MKLSVLFPLHTESLNAMLGANSRFIAQGRAKRDRRATGLALTQLPTPDHATIARGVTVTLCRVSPGTLDRANLHGALKHVEDAVATWLGRDDRDPTITWNQPEQQKCERGYHGVRVTYEDDRPGKALDVVVGKGPTRLSAASEQGGGDLPSKSPRRRVVSNHAPGMLLLPWDQDGSGVPVLDEIHGGIVGDGAPFIVAPVPALVPGLRAHARDAIMRIAARTVRLERNVVRSEELGGRVVVYAELGARELVFFATTRDPNPHPFDCFDPTTPHEEIPTT